MDTVVRAVPNEGIQDSVFGESITGLVAAHGDLHCRMSSGIYCFPPGKASHGATDFVLMHLRREGCY